MATASAPRKPTNIDDLLQCPICLDILRDPKVLDCQHTFCAECLKLHFASQARIHGTTNSIDCPNCRGRTNIINHSIDSLPGNYIVRDIIERQYGQTVPERSPGYSQQIQDRLKTMKKEKEVDDDNEEVWSYVKPAAAALVGVLGGLLLAKGVKKMCSNDKK